MKITTKTLIISTILGCMASQVVARDHQGRGRRHDGLRERFRRDMNICSEIKSDYESIRSRYDNIESRITSIDRQHSQMSGQVSQREAALTQARQALQSTDKRLKALLSKRDQAPNLVRRLRTKVSNLKNKQLPQAMKEKEAAELNKRRKCKSVADEFKPSCWKAKERRDKARARVKKINTQITQALNEIKDLNNIDQVISSTQRELSRRQRELSAEQNRTPGISSLRNQLRDLDNQRSQVFRESESIDENLIRAEIKLEKCESMRFDAIVYRVMNEYIAQFKTNGCGNLDTLLYTARRPAKKKGIQQAYDLVCRNTCNDNGRTPPRNDDDWGGSPAGSIRTIPFHFQTGDPYADNLNKRIVLEKAGAREIKLDLHGFDIEHNYDFLYVYDEDGNEVIRFTNDNKNPVRETRSTGWVRGSKLVLKFITDGRTAGAGFRIDSFQVRY